MPKKYFLFFISTLILSIYVQGQGNTVWSIGLSDNLAQGMALYPDHYKDYIKNDFGFEDRFFLIGFHDATKNFPYVLPGPKNGWAGTGTTSGIRSHFQKIDFELSPLKIKNKFQLWIDILDTDSKAAPELKILINKKPWYFKLKKGSGKALTSGKGNAKEEQLVKIDLPDKLLSEGFNEIELTILNGSWVIFDQIKLTSKTSVNIVKPNDILLRSVTPANYEILKKYQKYQPLLLDLAYLQNSPNLKVTLGNNIILNQRIEKGSYLLEAPMPAVLSQKTSKYKIFIDDKMICKGTVIRSPQKLQLPADYVNTLIGTAHSRWMITPGPWMPFSMVKLSPDNQNGGWQAGYDPTFESIGTFSHIHEWTMTGLGIFPTLGKLQTTVGDQSDPESGYRSRIDKNSEKGSIGLYQVDLTDTRITAELTSTTRASFQKYTFPKGEKGRIMIDLTIPSEYPYKVLDAEIKKISDHRIEGYSHQLSSNTWAGGIDQEYIVHFVIEFDQPIQSYGSWVNDHIRNDQNLKTQNPEQTGMFVEFDTQKNHTIQLRTGISYVSIENASLNLKKEISDPFQWNFEEVVQNNRLVWNELLSRITIESNDKREKERFYTNMYRALASRNIFSDVDGRWRDADEIIQQFKDPNRLALGCDAFWNTFWNLNQFWNLITPEWSSRWVKSQLAMYDTSGWLAKGPAGMEYIPVMVAEHEIPLIVGAYQMGIRDFDVEKAFEAVIKMQTTPAQKVGGGLAGNRDLEVYLEHQYVPYDKGRFSNSLEYSFDDWTVSQFAKSLGKEEIYQTFKKRGYWWKNIIDPETGFARMKDSKGEWVKDFDPFRSGANHHYVEGNAWQLTFFVPQDIPALINKIGLDTFTKRLEWGFEESYQWRFNGPNDQYWDYPVVQGNQQSMHFAFLFNWAEKPWLTQKWSRAIMERYYGYGVTDAYLGDEDQGQMSAWFVMNAIGLFQTDGGTNANPIYEIGSPLFDKIQIDLGNQYGRGSRFTIKTINNSRKNLYIQKATLNGNKLESFRFPASELLKGGELILEMGPEPNKFWGIGNYQ